MSMSCFSYYCCCCTSNQTTPNLKTKFRRSHQILKQLHIFGVLIAQIIASAVLIAFILWLFIRLPEPQVHVTGLEVDTLNKAAADRTLLHYNFTLHNPDLYKSLNYDVLVLRITYSDYATKYGATINFDVDGKGIHQRPGETMLLSNHTVNYTDYDVEWDAKDMIDLKTKKTYIILRFVMDVTFLAFNRVVGSRQMMRTADIYFDDAGKAFIDHRRGVMLK